MIQNFADQSVGKAQRVIAGFKGWLIIWSLAPVWVGTSEAGLNGTTNPPAGGFNGEVRDGIYLPGYLTSWPTGIPTPFVFPWNGDVYLLNGAGTFDSPNNVAFVLAVPEC